MSKIKLHLAVLSVMGGISLLAPSAFAQTRSNQNGHALDANNQIGSGGMNQNTPGPSPLSFQNNVATENVTKGAGFRGRDVNGVDTGVGYTDPFAFRGLLAGEGVDQFIANSTGVPTMANPSASSATFSAPPQPFYGAANNVAPPPGFTTLPNAPGYVPSQPTTPNPNDLRLGTVDLDAPAALPKPGEYIMPGPVDPNAPTAPTFFTLSPLYGARAWDVNGNSDLFSVQTPLAQSAGESTLTQTPNAQRVAQLRNELNGTNSQNGTNVSNPTLSPAPFTPGYAAGTQTNQAPTPQGILPQSLPNGTPSSLGYGTQSIRQTPPNLPAPPPPDQQSSQYKELLRRYNQIQATAPKTDADANRQFQQLMQLRQQVIQAANAPLGDFGTAERHASRQAMATTRAESVPPMPSFPVAPGGPPLQINSYAAGMNAKGLSDLIAGGEEFVRHQQYDKAIGVYDQAIDVAPNNPLILVGRADAELGGGYYRQASVDLHAAFTADPAVLLSQYDLQKHFGLERVRSLAADLEGIAQTSPNDPTHAFLLAYVLYNTHREGEAAQWVQVADQRSGGQDSVLVLMKKYWNFNQTGPTVIRPAAPPATQP